MKKKFIILFCAAFSVASLSAQQLDPVVEVSRAYQGKLIEVHKPAIEMAVPDTVQSFDLNFDYSVFDNPYKSSGEFSPYLVDMTPAPMQPNASQLYLNAGAGYTLHPTFDLVWSPFTKGSFRTDIYGMHRSYVGQYRALNNGSAWDGYDLLSKAGVDLGCEWDKAVLEFGASYYGVAVKDYLKSRTYNAADAYLTLKSKAPWPKNFMYDIKAAYRFADDRSLLRLLEHNFNLDATFGPSFDKNNKMFFDVGVDYDFYSGAYSSTLGHFYFLPHYVYEKDAVYVELGVCLSASLSSGKFKKTQIVYPDITVDVKVIPDALKMSLKVRGGEALNTYASILDENHHMDLGYSAAGLEGLLAPTVERVSAELGFDGRISGFFSYCLRGGYSNFKNELFDMTFVGSDGAVLPGIGYSKYQKAYAALDWDLNFEGVRFDGNVEYTHSWGFDPLASSIFRPSMLKGDGRVEYNWKKRVMVGVDCNFATAKTNLTGIKMPGYADLGAYAEYAINRKFSIWLRGGNFLNMEIQRNLFFAEKGINFTAGICLSL